MTLPTEEEILTALREPRDLDGLVRALRPDLYGAPGRRGEAQTTIAHVRASVEALAQRGKVRSLCLWQAAALLLALLATAQADEPRQDRRPQRPPAPAAEPGASPPRVCAGHWCMGLAGANVGAASDSATSHGGGRTKDPPLPPPPPSPCATFDHWGHASCPQPSPEPEKRTGSAFPIPGAACQDSPTPRLCTAVERVLGLARMRAALWVLAGLVLLRVAGYLVLRRRHV